MPASEEINADNSSVDIDRQCLEKHDIPYVVGKIWTTAAIYRETRKVIEQIAKL